MANKLDAAAMLKLYNSIQDESAKDNVYVCNSVLRCLIRKGKFDTAVKLFQQMKHDGLVPDVVTYSTVCHSKSSDTFIVSVNFTCLLLLHAISQCME